MARVEMDYNGKLQVLCQHLAKIIEKLIMVCTPCENSLDVSLLVFQKHFVCERRYSVKS